MKRNLINGLLILAAISFIHGCTKEDPKSMAADYYVVKSFDLTELKTKISRALDTHIPI